MFSPRTRGGCSRHFGGTQRLPSAKEVGVWSLKYWFVYIILNASCLARANIGRDTRDITITHDNLQREL